MPVALSANQCFRLRFDLPFPLGFGKAPARFYGFGATNLKVDSIRW